MTWGEKEGGGLFIHIHTYIAYTLKDQDKIHKQRHAHKKYADTQEMSFVENEKFDD
jgi:hypothetical protein